MKTQILGPLSVLFTLLLFTDLCAATNTNETNKPLITLAKQPLKDTIGVDTTIFTKVEVEASFPGGAPGWIEFLQTNLKADIPVRRKAPVGKYTVIVQFIVDKKGSLSDIKALTSFGYGMEGEVVRVLRKSPRWLPAQMNGGPVKAYRKQPITFEVSEVSK